MPQFLAALVIALLLLLLAVLLVRTLRFRSRQVQVSPAGDEAAPRAGAVERLAGAIRFPTISHLDPAQFDRPTFEGLHDYLARTFPRVHANLQREIVGDYSLLYTWPGQDPALRPIVLMGHIDVVPVEPGTEGDWTYPPFSGRIAGGYVWGRGTLDVKVAVVGALEAVETLLERGFQPRRTVLLAFGHDEEVSGQGGAGQIAALLQSRGIEPEFVLDEGGAITEGAVAGFDKAVALVGIAEKGYVSLAFDVESAGGHSSMPPRHTAIGILSAAIHRLESRPCPGRIAGPLKLMFEYLGPEMSPAMRVLLSNLWLFGPLVQSRLSASPAMNAALRTTTAPTMFEAGVKDNILPLKARAVVNFRVCPGESVQDVLDRARRTVDDPRVKISIPPGTRGWEPSPVSDVTAPAFDLLQRAIRQVFPDVVVAPYLVMGATDSRYYARFSRSVFRFTPIWLQAGDLNRAHGTDERIGVENYEQCVRFYLQLIRSATG